MGGGSCGCGSYNRGDDITLALFSKGKRILYIDGEYDEKRVVVDWGSGGSNIGADGSSLPGKRTLEDQILCVQGLMDKDFPNLEYDIRINDEGGSEL